MKKIASLLLGCFALVLTGCLDTVEELTIGADGSGVYTNTVDMSGMISMLEMMAAMDTSAKNGLQSLKEQNMDSVLAFRDLIAQDSSLTAEQKRLFSDAKMNIVMKGKEGVMKFGMTYPFKKLEDVAKIQAMNNAGKGVGLFGNKGKDNPMMQGLGDEGLPDIGKYLDLNLKNGLLERKVNAEKIKELQKDEKFQQMGQAEEMLESVTFTSIIRLPRPATAATGSKVELSADKKTVTIKTSMKDVMTNPKALDFRITY